MTAQPLSDERLGEIREFLGDPETTVHIAFPSEIARELLAALDACRARCHTRQQALEKIASLPSETMTPAFSIASAALEETREQ